RRDRVTMKLSEEIVAGRENLKPRAGVFNDGNGNGCAFGMADIASGSTSMYPERHPWIYDVPSHPLPCNCVGEALMAPGAKYYLRESFEKHISMQFCHLFNFHACRNTWTMERFIDWVRSVEPS